MINHRLKQLREGGLLDKYISDGLEKVGNLESGKCALATAAAALAAQLKVEEECEQLMEDYFEVCNHMKASAGCP